MYAFCSEPVLNHAADFFVSYNVLRFHVNSRPQDTFSFLGGAGDFRLTGVPADLASLNFTTETHDNELVVSIPSLVRAAYQVDWLPSSPVSDRFRRVIFHLLR